MMRHTFTPAVVPFPMSGTSGGCAFLPVLQRRSLAVLSRERYLTPDARRDYWWRLFGRVASRHGAWISLPTLSPKSDGMYSLTVVSPHLLSLSRELMTSLLASKCWST